MKFFGTDGIRGTWGQAPFDEYTLSAIAAAFAEFAAGLPDPDPARPGRAVIGHDGRASAGDISRALAAALAAKGVACESPGLTSTPALAYATRAGRYRLGIMISASHNPAADNGLKLFAADGAKVDDAAEAAIEDWIRRFLVEPPPKWPEAKLAVRQDLEGFYAMRLQHALEDWPAPPGAAVVVDCANGGVSRLAPDILRRFHLTVIPIHYAPDGHNINLDCGAMHPEVCAAEVKARAAELGLSFDGDGDRLLAADKKGRILSGDHLLLAIALAAKKRGTLKGGGVAGTVMANFFLEEALARHELTLVRADVGDKQVAAAMAEHGMNFGGEQSGHLIARDFAPSGDGLLTALLFMGAMSELHETADSFLSLHPAYPQGLKSIRIPDKRELSALTRLALVREALERELGGHGRVLVRYSGTEPKIRLMAEAPHTAEVKDAIHRMETAVCEDFGIAPKK